jgi:hypothetical protein
VRIIANLCKADDPPPPPLIDRHALEKELAHLQNVLRELRAQLDNGRNQAANELNRGHTPNPHGLGEEINNIIPGQIQDVLNRVGDIKRILGN